MKEVGRGGRLGRKEQGGRKEERGEEEEACIIIVSTSTCSRTIHMKITIIELQQYISVLHTYIHYWSYRNTLY